jgi:hypothetical protein
LVFIFWLWICMKKPHIYKSNILNMKYCLLIHFTALIRHTCNNWIRKLESKLDVATLAYCILVSCHFSTFVFCVCQVKCMFLATCYW